MKHAMTIWFLVVAASVGAAEREAPEFTAFPTPGPGWSSLDGGKRGDGQFSWRHYKHLKTEDVVACVAWHAPGLSVDSSPVRQASIETITSDGLAYALTRKLGQPIADTVRHRAASINVRNRSAAQHAVYRAIEYTYVFETTDRKTQAATTQAATTQAATTQAAMAHGYVIVVGDFTVFIQHTANHVITSEIAQGMAMQLAVAWSAKQTANPEGWGASIGHPEQPLDGNQ